MKSFIAFLRNYWLLIVLFAVALLIFGNAQAFLVAGTVVYVPVLTFGGILLALAFRSIFNRDTTWPYVYDLDPKKGFDNDFNNLPASLKVWITCLQIWVYLIFIAIIIHAAMG
jgi:hypothetical protein